MDIRSTTSTPKAPLKKVLFLSDLDGTWLSKNPEKRAALDQGVVELKDEYSKRGIDLQFGYITARPPQRVVSENLPEPDWTVTDNGGFIHEGTPCRREDDGSLAVQPELQDWEATNASSGFVSEQTIARARALASQPQYSNLALHTVGEIVHSKDADACPYLSVLCIDNDSIHLAPHEAIDANGNGIPDIFESESFTPPLQVQAFAADLARELQSDGVQFGMSPVYAFQGAPLVMFDVASPVANKGHALEFLMDRQGIDPENVIIAGDGGNDIAMMRRTDGTDDGRRAIAVGGGADLYGAAGALKNAILQPGEMDCSEAVLDGLKKHLAEIASEGDRAA